MTDPVSLASRTANAKSSGKVAGWAELIEAAAAEVFTMMVSLDLGRVDSPEKAATYELTAMVGLAGTPCGVFSVSCGSAMALEIANNMLGTPGASLSLEETCDALGEICNMVAGSVKSRLPRQGAGCLMSVPTVVRGSNYEVRCLTHEAGISVTMHHGDVTVRFTLELQLSGSDSCP